MSATGVVRQLLEQDEPFGVDPLAPYTGPIEFNENIKHIIEHARMLKEQAEEAGALRVLQHAHSSGKPPSAVDIDRAFLMIAVEQFNLEMKAPGKLARILKREMHSIWD